MIKPPKIGRYWDGMGGLYAGVLRGDFHLILAEVDTKRDVIWQKAQSWAGSLIIDKWHDFRLPSRMEAALLYANLQDKCEDRWTWTGDDYSADKTCAWVQTFGYGRQADARKTDACRARAVRAFPCA